MMKMRVEALMTGCLRLRRHAGRPPPSLASIGAGIKAGDAAGDQPPVLIRKVFRKVPRMASSFTNSLSILAKARFPILYVETFEERRALAEIQATVGPGGLLPSPRPLHTWSITAGLVDPEGKSAPGTTDPLRALDAAQHTDHAATFAFFDLHAHLGDGARPADPAIVRKLRELSMDFQNGALPRTLIVVAPTII